MKPSSIKLPERHGMVFTNFDTTTLLTRQSALFSNLWKFFLESCRVIFYLLGSVNVNNSISELIFVRPLCVGNDFSAMSTLLLVKIVFFVSFSVLGKSLVGVSNCLCNY